MAHFVRTQLDATWTTGNYVPLLADWQSLSDKVFGSINGDKGGTWAPTSPLVISNLGLHVTGPTRVDYGGTLKTTTNARFVLGNNDYPKLASNHVGRLRTIRSDLTCRQSTPRYHWLAAPGYIGSIQTIACTINGASGIEQPKCSIPLKVHDGGRLIGATFTFRIPQTRTHAIIATPKIRFIRTDKDGNITSLRSVASGADVNGWVSMPTPATLAVWANNGAAQTYEFTCDQNNTIDCSQYLYWAQITEEVASYFPLPATGGNAADGILIRERKTAVKKVFTVNQGLTGTPAGTSVGDSVLLTASSTPAFNGIWVIGATWVRRFDLNDPSMFAPSFFLLDNTAEEAWELVSPVTPQSFFINLDPSVLSGGANITFQRRQPTGNIYHAIACHFDTITDMRPQ